MNEGTPTATGARDWTAWRRSRPATDLLHLDAAAAGRCSTATLEAVAEHQRREATHGGYHAEELAADVLDGLHARLAVLLGVQVDGVALTESASGSLDVLLRAWRLPAGARIAVAPSEWGPNLGAFHAADLSVEVLPVHDDGRLDLDGLERLLDGDPPDVVHLVHLASHRPLVQPVAEAVSRCRRAGVATWVDAAQSLGQLPTDLGADAFYAPSRKWLSGPRGVGVLAIAAGAIDRIVPRIQEKYGDGRPPVRSWSSDEAHVAGRMGLARALAELESWGSEATYERLAEVGRRTRDRLTHVEGWEVVAAAGDAAITALRPTRGQDVTVTRRRLLEEYEILTSPCLPWRAPGEAPPPALRLSPQVDLTDDDLERVATALSE